MRLLSLIALCLWLAFSGYWYACKVRCACNDGFALFSQSPSTGDSSKSDAATRIVAKDDSGKNESTKKPMVFNCNEFDLIQGSEYNDLLETLKRKASVMDSLHVKGFYSLKEVNRSKFANLGLARAHAIREVLEDQFEKTAITIDAEVNLEMGIKCDEPFSAAMFTWQ